MIEVPKFPPRTGVRHAPDTSGSNEVTSADQARRIRYSCSQCSHIGRMCNKVFQLYIVWAHIIRTDNCRDIFNNARYLMVYISDDSVYTVF